MLKILLIILLGSGAGFIPSSLLAQVPMPERKPFTEPPSSSNFIDRIGNFFSGPEGEKNAVEGDQALRQAPARAPSFKYPSAYNMSLSAQDASLYKRVFRFQRTGQMEQADDLIGQIENALLMGHVLYQRYMHPTAYKSEFNELKRWLDDYADHPGAEKIYSLAQKKDGAAQSLKMPLASRGLPRVREPTMRPAKTYISPRARSSASRKEAARIMNAARRAVRREGAPKALAYIGQKDVTDVLDGVEIGILKADIAAGFLHAGEMDKAFDLAVSAMSGGGKVYAPKGAWVAGLVCWHREDYDAAGRYFEMAATSSYASGWLITAASYWSARAKMRSGDVTRISSWLERGMAHPRTFYGLISTRALGVDFDFNWDMPTFTKEYHDILIGSPAGARAVALAKAEQHERAQSELIRRQPESDQEYMAYLAFGGYAHLPALSMRLASMETAGKGFYHDAALYPHIPWEPEGGYVIDKALLHAIMKQESRFDPEAESYRGAKGLMQLMPATARGVGGAKADFLDDPYINLQIGQRYLKRLLGLPAVENNLLYLLIAYNAGPGNLVKWKKLWPDVDDPLLFIELIPSAETRAYIERVLANYWIYRMREGESIESMEAIAAGRPALYTQSE